MTIVTHVGSKKANTLIGFIVIQRDVDKSKYLHLWVRGAGNYVADLATKENVNYLYLQSIDEPGYNVYMKISNADTNRLLRLCKLAYWWRYK